MRSTPSLRRLSSHAAIKCFARPSSSQRPFRTRESAFRRHADTASVTIPGSDGAGDQPLVVSALGFVPAVRIRCVEPCDARIECRMQYLNRARIVAIRLCRQPHASDGRPSGEEVSSTLLSSTALELIVLVGEQHVEARERAVAPTHVRLQLHLCIVGKI